MSNLETRYVVNGSIESTDTTLLDTIEAQLPSESNAVIGNEYAIDRTPVLDDSGNATGAEVLSGRMTFARDGSEFTRDADGNVLVVIENGEPGTNEVLKQNVDSSDIFGPADAAQTLFGQITSHDLAAQADGWEIRLYESPEGAFTTTTIQEWYEEDESRQPTDEHGEKYVPESFDPSNHIIAEDSG